MSNKAILYRMVTDDHVCPYGIRSKDLLRRKGFEVEDNTLKTRAEADAFMSDHGVKTTPQTFIGGNRIGGYDALREHFDMPPAESDETSYQPVIAVFAVTFLMALAVTWSASSSLRIIPLLELFIAFSMCVLAILKLRDLYAFSNQFITYDLLGRRYVPYAYVYPFVEGIGGVCMIAGVFMPVVAPIVIVASGIGAVSVFRAVYIEKRDLKCACVGGNSNVPLGAISLTENVMMFLMAIWMLAK